jgi:hypothetical protein
MSLNLEYKGYQYFDEHNLMLIDKDPFSYKDCGGRTVLAAITYDLPDELNYSIELLVRFEEDRYVLYRHPKHPEVSSRDHFSYIIIHRKLKADKIGKDLWLRYFIKDVPFMRGLYLWMHTLIGNKLAEYFYYLLYIPGAYIGNVGLYLWMHTLIGNKLAEYFYYLLYIPGAYIGNVWNKLIRRVGKCKPERSNEWWGEKYDDLANGVRLQRNLTRWQKFWLHGFKFKWRGKKQTIPFLIPTYSLHVKAWQIYVLPESRRKDKLKRILLKRVGKYNYLLRLLFGDKTVTQEEVENYRHMTNWRWGVNLDESCDRHVVFAEDIEYNALETDLLKKIYYET